MNTNLPDDVLVAGAASSAQAAIRAGKARRVLGGRTHPEPPQRPGMDPDATLEEKVAFVDLWAATARYEGALADLRPLAGVRREGPWQVLLPCAQDLAAGGSRVAAIRVDAFREAAAGLEAARVALVEAQAARRGGLDALPPA